MRMYFPTALVNVKGYQSLDTRNPIHFRGDYIVYDNDTIHLGEKAFYIDGNLPRRIAKHFPYVFRSIQEAKEQINNGTEAEPMVLYIAPYVYWIDDPDDPEVRKPKRGGTPFGMVFDTSWLTFYGLNPDPKNVILACNRGQTQGAVGNFTMFQFNGDGIRTENITFGNYCNVDLSYPLLPKLNRAKRYEAITQAQLALCKTDKIVAVNSAFVSRLNSCPFVGSKRAFFENCHFECTDDALCGSAVYLNCDLDFYSSKPFWSTHGTGAVFLNCDFNILTSNAQYLTKVGSQVALIDCRFHHPNNNLRLAWTEYPKASMRCYQYNVTLNGQEVLFQADKPFLTVDMTNKAVLDAYRFEYNGEIVYNTYNLLRGNDDWDPMQIKDIVIKASQAAKKDYTLIPTCLSVKPSMASIETGVNDTTLSCQTFRFYDIPIDENITWSVPNPQEASLVKILPQSDGSCQVVGNNHGETPQEVMIEARTVSGLKSAAVIKVAPKTLRAPHYIYMPYLNLLSKGRLRLSYKLYLEDREDHSLITWYRCKDAEGNEAIPVCVSRLNQPERTYTLSKGDVGYYIMAGISPKHIRSRVGKEERVVWPSKIERKHIIDNDSLYTNFQNFPTETQKAILPGFWTVDAYKPADTDEYHWVANAENAWFYGQEQGGCTGYGLLQKNKGARLLYTPVEGKYQDMQVSLVVDPCKTAGQGFGSATGQYMDVYIKFDTHSLSGYALRIIRTTKYANAVDFVLMKYDKGKTEAICEPVSATCYRTGCHIAIHSQGDQLIADITTSTAKPQGSNLPHEVHLKADITPNDFGGFGIQHTGSTGSSATMLHELSVVYSR